MQDRLDRGAVFRRMDPSFLHRALEAVEMVGKPEEAALEHMHDVIDDIGARKPQSVTGSVASAIGT